MQFGQSVVAAVVAAALLLGGGLKAFGDDLFRTAARGGDDVLQTGGRFGDDLPPVNADDGVSLTGSGAKAEVESEAARDQYGKQVACYAIDFVKLTDSPTYEEFQAYVGNLPPSRRSARIFESVTNLGEGDLGELQSLYCEF